MINSPGEQYLSDRVLNASPSERLTMLYDRLVVDLMKAEQLSDAGDPIGARKLISHAYEIVASLYSSLKEGGWSGAQGLKLLYAYALSKMNNLTIKWDSSAIKELIEMFTELATAWHGAARSLAGSGTATPVEGATLNASA